MATVYIKYQAAGVRAGPKDCTSALPANTGQSIIMSGLYEGKATNLMVLDGVTADIENWITQNSGKVERITEAEGDAIGQSISPAGVYRDSSEGPGGGTTKHYLSGTFTMAGGQAWEEITYLYMHVTMVDGDGKEPIGLKNDGIDYMTATCTFRATENPLSPVITSINEEWRVLIRDNDSLIYDVVLVVFTNGVATLVYKTINKPGICTMQESDLELIELGGNTYKVKLANTVKFFIYRTL